MSREYRGGAYNAHSVASARSVDSGLSAIKEIIKSKKETIISFSIEVSINKDNKCTYFTISFYDNKCISVAKIPMVWTNSIQEPFYCFLLVAHSENLKKQISELLTKELDLNCFSRRPPCENRKCLSLAYNFIFDNYKGLIDIYGGNKDSFIEKLTTNHAFEMVQTFKTLLGFEEFCNNMICSGKAYCFDVYIKTNITNLDNIFPKDINKLYGVIVSGTGHSCKYYDRETLERVDIEWTEAINYDKIHKIPIAKKGSHANYREKLEIINLEDDNTQDSLIPTSTNSANYNQNMNVIEIKAPLGSTVFKSQISMGGKLHNAYIVLSGNPSVSPNLQT
ncbi:hypothetical protein C1645_807642 [Glomus cerebriforme]|uniref:Uncharacterized protein n=1 Tax=Glomus cerebriforme TaxID=658196 RepID=A0A397SQ59_9GLOM|nr:hypothetical protein C1645_807642 [Glomus cerebriforme]